MSLTRKEIELTKAIIELILDVGAPVAIQAFKSFDISDDPTPDEIRDLKNILKDPSHYWKDRNVSD